jgi:carbamoyltransferase
MFTLGLAGGLDAVHEQRLDTPENYTYDGAAVLLEDGVVVAAIEEERLDRIKHSNKFPVRAIRFCLESRGLSLTDLSSIAYYVDEAAADALLTRMYLTRPEFPCRMRARTLMHATLGAALSGDFDSAKLRFYEHRLTHAACAMHQSGFEASLVFVIDNAGGLYAGRRGPEGAVSMETLVLTPPAKALQKLCHAILPFLGLGLFEEYKALALAALGDGKIFKAEVGGLYELLPGGEYRLHLDRVPALIAAIEPPRSGAELHQRHYDLAASLQRAMEEIVLHILKHYQAVTGLRHLCVAGGMAENVETNSALLYSGLFDEVFVHPAAYDSGCALGAALLASQDDGRPAPQTRVQGVRWGSSLASRSAIDTELRRWSGFLRAEHNNDAVHRAAEMIAGGSLVAWVEGRSDFGSHALGSRNVLALPNSVENAVRLHRALGRPETYRQLALLIREEDVEAWCELPPGYGALPFQTFTVRVRASKYAQVAAALNADGKAKVQTVSRELHPRLWGLLGELEQMKSAPALLSASFNRSSEPTVESIEDAAACFIASGLDYLVAGDLIAERTAASRAAWMSLTISLPPYTQLVRTKGWSERKRRAIRDEICTTYAPGPRKTITQTLGDLLTGLDEEISFADLLARAALDPEKKSELMNEIIALSSAGMIDLRPSAASEVTA